jgi:ribulose-phosphate 3-epimerase/16S rRNA (cytosine(967)-C(5))-methyltransferase
MQGTPEATTRKVACDALVRVEDGAYSHVLLPSMLRRSKLKARDRAQVTDLVYGTLRARRRLDDLLERVSDRPLRRLDPPVRAALRIGAFQLLQGVAPHAAVSETVEAAPRRARGYVNATLRALVRLGPAWPEPAEEAVALSYPDWLVERLRADLGADDAHGVLVAANTPPALTLRLNPRRSDGERVAAELTAQGAIVVPGELVDGSLVVRGTGDPAALGVVSSGRATPQDQGSQAVVRYLEPGGDDRVLDVAAAPGGKATAIAELLDDDGYVVAADVHAGRLGMVRVAATRLALANIAPVVADARQPPVRSASFDRVLVDAPCSGLGAMAHRPRGDRGDGRPAARHGPVRGRDRASRRCARVRGLHADDGRDHRSGDPSGRAAPGLDGARPSRAAVAPPRAGCAAPAPGCRHRRHVRPRTASRRQVASRSMSRRTKIAPSILSADFACLADDVGRVSEEADLLHVDVMDGHFVPNLTIGPPVVASLRARTDLFLDCHLMVDNPGVLLADFAKAGADRCIVHVELGDPRPLFAELRERGLGVGLTLNPDTPVESVLPYLADIDLLLVMSVHPGFGGQAFISAVLDKVRVARRAIDDAGLAVEIEIDGGINVDTARDAVAAGVDILVAGSAIFAEPDPAAAARAIRDAARLAA